MFWQSFYDRRVIFWFRLTGLGLGLGLGLDFDLDLDLDLGFGCNHLSAIKQPLVGMPLQAAPGVMS